MMTRPDELNAVQSNPIAWGALAAIAAVMLFFGAVAFALSLGFF